MASNKVHNFSFFLFFANNLLLLIKMKLVDTMQMKLGTTKVQ